MLRERPLRTPDEFHRKNHEAFIPYTMCGRCIRSRMKCKRKVRLNDRAEADEWVEDFNRTHEYVKPVIRYRCRWCLFWHLATAKTKLQRLRAERQRRKWLIEQRNKA